MLAIEALRATGLVASDAAIALVFPALFSLGVLGVHRYADDIHLDLDSTIYGEIAFVPFRTLSAPGGRLWRGRWCIWGSSACVNLALVSLLWKELKATSFDPEFARTIRVPPRLLSRLLLIAVAVTAVTAFESVGAILVVTLLIVPAAAAYLLTDRLVAMVIVSVVIGWVSAVAGYCGRAAGRRLDRRRDGAVRRRALRRRADRVAALRARRAGPAPGAPPARDGAGPLPRRAGRGGLVRRLRLLVVLVLAAVLAALASGCVASADGGGDVSGRQIRVTTTTNFITDLAREIGGDRVEVTGLLGPGVDPHLYKASARDVQALRDADAILYGGLELEGRMADLLEELSSRKPTVAVTRDMPESQLRRPSEFEGKVDPHVWFSVPLWRHAATTTAEALAEIDTGSAGAYRARARAYVAELDALDAYVRERIASIPERSRVLITSHDAFGYFGREYDIDVVAIQGGAAPCRSSGASSGSR